MKARMVYILALDVNAKTDTILQCQSDVRCDGLNCQCGQVNMEV